MIGKTNLATSLLLVAACILAITGCVVPAPVTTAPVQESGESAPAGEDHSQDLYIYVSSMGNLEFFNAHKYGWQWAGETLGVQTDYVGPAEYDLNAMVAAFDRYPSCWACWLPWA